LPIGEAEEEEETSPPPLHVNLSESFLKVNLAQVELPFPLGHLCTNCKRIEGFTGVGESGARIPSLIVKGFDRV
jgi:hypothetical protein